jgi:hypothetical protein
MTIAHVFPWYSHRSSFCKSQWKPIIMFHAKMIQWAGRSQTVALPDLNRRPTDKRLQRQTNLHAEWQLLSDHASFEKAILYHRKVGRDVGIARINLDSVTSTTKYNHRRICSLIRFMILLTGYGRDLHEIDRGYWLEIARWGSIETPATVGCEWLLWNRNDRAVLVSMCRYIIENMGQSASRCHSEDAAPLGVKKQ